MCLRRNALQLAIVETWFYINKVNHVAVNVAGIQPIVPFLRIVFPRTT
jgi:hypothetical protein